MNPLIFRAYDIRGIFGKDFNAKDVEKIGRAFATLLRPKTIVIGHDNRESSDEIKNAVINGLVSSGVNVIDIGMVPTPVLYYAIIKLKTDGGIMITASHLTSEWNGLKLCRENAVPLAGEEIQEVKQILEKESFIVGDGKVKKHDIIPEYVKEVRNKLNFKRRLKVIFDFGNGTAGIIMKKILEDENIDSIFLFDDPDPRFPNHWPDPSIEENLNSLKEAIVNENADLGVAFDGDGDRVFFLDEKGRVVRGDQTLALLSEELLRERKAKILFEVKCSRLLVEWIKKHGGEPLMYRTGHSFIVRKMHSDPDIFLAGEMSGHLYFKDFYCIDDALHASIRFLNLISSSPYKPSQLVQRLPSYFSTPEIRVNVSDKEKFKIVEAIKNELQRVVSNRGKIITIDGVRIELENGWGLVRASNTSPCLILRFEGKTEKDLKEIHELFSSVLSKYELPLPPLETGLS